MDRDGIRPWPDRCPAAAVINVRGTDTFSAEIGGFYRFLNDVKSLASAAEKMPVPWSLLCPATTALA